MSESENLVPLKGSSEFPFWEQDLARLFGVPPVELQKIRTLELVEGVNFIRLSNRICYSKNSARSTAVALRLPLENLPWLQEPATPETPQPAYTPPALALLTALPHRTANPHIIMAQNEKGVAVRVRVKNKENFRGGMKLQATLISADYYELVGHCPRYPGKF